ncbi:MAG: 50S ribosomal protein L27 [Candidatus Colwellbacteria bacterium RIFCSPHIGHO2_12_FULL_44_17]|uniref:Large ribosomal subunit protein bL27 n=1 Tax=Candidatus Colwellbacteria bacterium RIFCSPHIGHO2_12_FULL_44_17 TaxID=1797689 RepID=A0A1G1Z6F5_9BACT|nr:MAG: 50S ribosomal protein L27 [Candidatus Colwellbacteria bacterium RIFCSPHIGHO2_12_FULL_44_17]
MAHTKSLGTTKLGRDSASKRLGVKRSDGQAVTPGQILIRQRGTRYLPGKNVKRAGDDTLLSLVSGVVKFSTKKKVGFSGKVRMATVVSVLAS